MRWRDIADQMAHEEVHLLWGREVGEAPALLNEGVAVYVERLLSPRADEGTDELRDAWSEMRRDGATFLRRLSRNDGFWAAYAERRPVYGVGGALVGYLVEVHGLALLRGIFEATHYEYDGLAPVIEERVGLRLEELEERVGDWWRSYARTVRSTAV